MSELAQKILACVREEKYDIDILTKILIPIPVYTNNDLFNNNIRKIVSILLNDRNDDNKFSVEDLVLLKDDIAGIMSLASAVLLVINSVTDLKFKYQAGETEEIILKVLFYIFFVVVPNETKLDLKYEEKELIITFCLQIYDIIKSSEITKQLVSEISAWFKKSCNCMKSQEDTNQKIVDKHLPKINYKLQKSVSSAREKAILYKKIDSLEKHIKQKKKTK